jgi:hypothetical protein
VLSVGTQQPESLVQALSDSHADEAAPLSITERDVCFLSPLLADLSSRRDTTPTITSVDKTLRSLSLMTMKRLMSKNLK